MMKCRSVTSVAALGLVLAMATTASAQDEAAKDTTPVASDAASPGAKTHDGFYFNTSLGLGYYNMSAETVPGGPEASFSGLTASTALLFGGTVGQGVVIGGGLTIDYASSPSYSVDGNDVDVNVDYSQFLLSIGPFVDYYLDPKGGLHFFGMAGWGGVETSAEGNVGGSDPTGLVLTVGAGHDWFISDEWSAGVMGRLAYAPLSMNDVDFPTIAPAIVGTITYH